MDNIFKKWFSKKSEEVNKLEEVQSEEDNVAEETIEKTDASELILNPKRVDLGQSKVVRGEEQDNFFAKLKKGLSKTSKGMKEKINGILANFRKIDEELFEELEEMLIISDIGVQTTQKIIENIKEKVKLRNVSDPQEIRNLLKEEIKELLKDNQSEMNLNTVPSVIVIVGVNGSGKTTSIGKIAHKLKTSGKKVLIAAGDTFRAAAIDQLEVWGKRVGVDVIKHKEGADPGAVIYDAIQSAKAKGVDVLICDTAGRLHNKKNLMNELGKVERIINKELPESSKEVLLVIDATTGQNAVQQAKIFGETINLTGIVLTKLDGTAKGGMIVTIKSELNIPIKFIGVGEGIEDLQRFNPEDFVNALFD